MPWNRWRRCERTAGASSTSFGAGGSTRTPPRFPVDGRVSEVVARFADLDAAALEARAARTRVGGRVTAIRTHGKAAFLDLSDGDGRIQVYVKQDVVGAEAFGLLETLDLGDFWGAEGVLFRTRTGELTVRAESVTVLSKGLQPWPEKWHGLTDRELRARQRYLDLATNPESRKVFQARAAIVRAIRSFLDGRGFTEVETPMMQPIPGGASARGRSSRTTTPSTWTSTSASPPSCT